MLRSWSYGENNYSCVEGDEIIHRGRSVTPNELARAFARTNRNAWLDLRIRRPGDKQLRQADLMRKEVQQEQEEARKAKASLAAQAIAPPQAPAAPSPALAEAPQMALPP